MTLPTIAEIRKALAAFSSAVLVAVSAGLITGQTAVYVSGLIAALIAGFATWASKANDPPTARRSTSG